MTDDLVDGAVLFDYHYNSIADLRMIYDILWEQVEGFDPEFADWDDEGIDLVLVPRDELLMVRKAFDEEEWDGPKPRVDMEEDDD